VGRSGRGAVGAALMIGRAELRQGASMAASRRTGSPSALTTIHSRLSAPSRSAFTCETARAASVGALAHGRLPGSYEELVAAR
jgi:hypothetical protein